MHRESALALVAVLCASLGAFTQASSFAQSVPVKPASNGTAPVSDSAQQAVYFAGPDVTAPVLLSPAMSVTVPKRCIERNGVVRFSAVVSADGVPRDITTVHSDDARLNAFALRLVETQRFKPGLYKGVPSSVAIELTLGMQTCVSTTKHATDSEEETLTLRAHPLIAVNLRERPATLPGAANSAEESRSAPGADRLDVPYQVGGHISAPIPVFQPDPELDDFVKNKRITGSCLIDTIIDANGIPRKLHVVKSLEPHFDHDALETAKTWRFKPALKDGRTPVPVEVTIAANIRRYEKVRFSFAAMAAASPDEILDSAGEFVNSHITPPVPLNANEIDADYSYYGRLNRIRGSCIVGFFVDTHGVPQNVHVIKGLELGMDENAVYAAQQMRFKPAMKDGTTPVPFEVLMPVNFKLRVQKRQLIEKMLTAAVFIWAL